MQAFQSALTNIRPPATRIAMRKTFSLSDPKHAPARVVEAIKSDVRKYLKRERGKKLPEGIAHWDFDCRSGRDESDATSTHAASLPKAIDAAAAENWPGIYIEILVKHGRPASKPPTESPEVAPTSEDNPLDETAAGDQDSGSDGKEG